MSRSVLFYPDEAAALNQAIQKDIAAHLFMFCNYNPTPLKVFSADARFIKAITNLYKLMIDSSVVNRISKLCYAGKLQIDIARLQEYSALSNNLRTVVGHNLSNENGTGEEILKYERWLKAIIGKTELECEEDYEKPLQKLEEIAAHTMDILRDFVNKVSVAPLKKAVIADWEKYIIELYCKETNKNIFMGQVYDAYLANHRSVIGDNRQIDYQLAMWIRDRYYRVEETEIRNLQDILNTTGHKLSIEVKVQIQKKIDDAQAAMDAREAATAADCNCSVSVLRSKAFLYKNHYCRDLKPKLTAALAQIKQTNEGTMMPHDIMQMIIIKDLRLDK